MNQFSRNKGSVKDSRPEGKVDSRQGCDLWIEVPEVYLDLLREAVRRDRTTKLRKEPTPGLALNAGRRLAKRLL